MYRDHIEPWSSSAATWKREEYSILRFGIILPVGLETEEGALEEIQHVCKYQKERASSLEGEKEKEKKGAKRGREGNKNPAKVRAAVVAVGTKR